MDVAEVYYGNTVDSVRLDTSNSYIATLSILLAAMPMVQRCAYAFTCCERMATTLGSNIPYLDFASLCVPLSFSFPAVLSTLEHMREDRRHIGADMEIHHGDAWDTMNTDT